MPVRRGIECAWIEDDLAHPAMLFQKREEGLATDPDPAF
jgi:hypothetical protein